MMFKFTDYFEGKVLKKRSYLTREMCERIVSNPIKRETQPDDRIRFWGLLPERGNRALRVVTLADGNTIHNAFYDRNFKMKGSDGLT